MTQAVSGWLDGAKSIELADVRIEAKTKKATLAVTSLDGKPIKSSAKMLVTAVAQVVPSQDDRMPFRAQPVEATISVRSAATLKLIVLEPDGDEGAEIKGTKSGDRQVFVLPSEKKTHWYLLRP